MSIARRLQVVPDVCTRPADLLRFIPRIEAYLTAGQIRLLAVILTLAVRHEGQFWATEKFLGESAGLKPRAAAEAMAALVALGIVRKVKELPINSLLPDGKRTRVWHVPLRICLL
jgi:hypothetical protein